MCRWRGSRFTQMRVGKHEPVVGCIGLSCLLDVICFSPWKFHFSLQASLLFNMLYCMDIYMRQLEDKKQSVGVISTRAHICISSSASVHYWEPHFVHFILKSGLLYMFEFCLTCPIVFHYIWCNLKGYGYFRERNSKRRPKGGWKRDVNPTARAKGAKENERKEKKGLEKQSKQAQK